MIDNIREFMWAMRSTTLGFPHQNMMRVEEALHAIIDARVANILATRAYPRPFTTVAELEALPVGSMVQAAFGGMVFKTAPNAWENFTSEGIMGYGPGTVMYIPPSTPEAQT